MLNVGTRSRIGVEWFDVEDNGNDIHVQPESGTQIRRLFEERNSDTCTQELAKMLDREFTECLKNILLDLLGVFLGIALHIGKGQGREVSAVD